MSTTALEIMSTLNVVSASTLAGAVEENRTILVVDDRRRPVGLVPASVLATAPPGVTVGELATQLPPITLVAPDVGVGTLLGTRLSEDAWFVVHRGREWLGAVPPSTLDRLLPAEPRPRVGEERFEKGIVYRSEADFGLGGLYGAIEVTEGKVSFTCEPDPPDTPHVFTLAKARKYYDALRHVICPWHHREMTRQVFGG